MAIHYVIGVNGVYYVPRNLSDTKAKLVWKKEGSGLVYKSWLDGSFTFNRAGNEGLYDAVMAMTFCYSGGITAYDQHDNVIVHSVFGKTDCEYNEDKCQIVFKPKFYEGNYACIGAGGDKDYNILNYLLANQTIKYTSFREFEFAICTGPRSYLFEDEFFSGVFIGWSGGHWYYFFEIDGFPRMKKTCPEKGMTSSDYRQLDTGWTFYSQKNTNIIVEPDFAGRIMRWDCTTIWFRETKLVPKIDDSLQGIEPPIGTSSFSWIYIDEVELNGYRYHKWVRCVDNLVVTQNQTSGYSWWYLTSYYGWYDPILSSSTDRKLTRCKKLNDILEYFATKCGCSFVSQFFTSSTNPVSEKDLSNLMIAQKSDCIFEIVPPSVTPTEKTDPATIGMITFNQLMENLRNMFQVYWYINADSELVVEHINFFRNNLSYTINTDVGVDLTTVYPMCLYGTKAYSYEKNIPMREKFNFMEAWNLDFRGADIEYTNCLTEGDTDNYSAELFTTDIDPVYLDGEASSEGFCMFHCDADNLVIREEGELSGLDVMNGHLSWANLHHYYWKYNRPLGTGMMNNALTTFDMNRKLVNQVEIQFPYCVNDFDPNKLIRTTLGDGEVKTAEYNFKTGNIVIQLIYE